MPLCSQSLICHSPLDSFSPNPRLWSPWFNTLDGMREKRAPLATSRTSGEAGCSLAHCPFPPMGVIQDLCCAILGDKWQESSQTLLPSPTSSISHMFALIGYWDFNWKPELPKRLSCLWLIGWVGVPQGLLDHGQEELDLAYGHLLGLQPGPRSVYVKFLCNTPPGSRGLWCSSHSIPESLQRHSVHRWMANFCFWGGDKNKSCVTMMLNRKWIFRRDS